MKSRPFVPGIDGSQNSQKRGVVPGNFDTKLDEGTMSCCQVSTVHSLD
jgi:hypothetical protein